VLPAERTGASSGLSQRAKVFASVPHGSLYGWRAATGGLVVLAILYVQFKDWRFGDWQALGQIHALGGLLLWALFLIYLLSWWAVGLGTRWEAYEALLI